ncbi:MAG: hypothetical protein Q9163_000745 [Psora crenata]
MDMFKLLARSTNLQKTKISPNKPIQSVPSAGSIPAPSPAKGAEDGTTKRKPGGIKRKRSGEAQGQKKEAEQKPNIIDDEPLIAGGINKSSDADNLVLKSKKPGSDKAQILDVSTPPLAGESAKQVLKEHKLKITILEGPPNSHAEQENPKTRARVTASKKRKEAHVQLTPKPLVSFGQLRANYGISRRLAENLDIHGYREPTEVQMGSLPLLLGSDEDRGLPLQEANDSEGCTRSMVDLLTIAPTGSGKTLAFMIPILHGLLKDQAMNNQRSGRRGDVERGVNALIIAPTHELVHQIVVEGRKLATGTKIQISAMRKGMRLHPDLLGQIGKTARSEDGQNDQTVARNDFLVKANIVVSTPLLLLHAISTSPSATSLPLPSIKYLVLDEADVLLDPMFREQTLGIWSACSSSSLCASLWSATMGSSIESLAQNFILDRRKHLSLDPPGSSPHYILRLVVGLKDSAIPNISHRLVYAASEQGKLLALRQLLRPAAGPSPSAPSLQPPFLIFTQTIPRAIALHSELLYDIPPEAGGSSRIAVLHADLSETARSDIMAGFRRGEVWILITTDLLSRGVDFRGLNGIVNYDIPNTSASYVHRAGRTGRQGRGGGIAVTLYTKEDIPYVKNVANVIAASERVSGAEAARSGRTAGGGVQQWLLDSLPDVSKKMKKDLKRKGVESRRANSEGVNRKKLTQMRISTKSGYDRRLEKRRKGAVMGRRSRIGEVEDEGTNSEDEEDWEGFGD